MSSTPTVLQGRTLAFGTLRCVALYSLHTDAVKVNSRGKHEMLLLPGSQRNHAVAQDASVGAHVLRQMDSRDFIQTL